MAMRTNSSLGTEVVEPLQKYKYILVAVLEQSDRGCFWKAGVRGQIHIDVLPMWW